MPFLVTDGGYKFGLANWTNQGIGNHNWKTCIPDIRNGPTTKHIRDISLVVRTTMAVDGTHQVNLVEKYHYLPERQDKSMSTNTNAHGHTQGADALVCRNH